MKKIVPLFLVMLFIGLAGCEREKELVELPVFEYPLEQEIIAQAMEKSDFSHDLTIEENEYLEADGIESTSFTLRHPSKDIYAGRCLGILSHKAEAFTSVGITVSSIDQDATFTEQEIEQAIRFATYLFWGDEKETRVYDAFVKEYNPGEKIAWQTQIDGVGCQIIYDPQCNYAFQIAYSTNLELQLKLVEEALEENSKYKEEEEF